MKFQRNERAREHGVRQGLAMLVGVALVVGSGVPPAEARGNPFDRLSIDIEQAVDDLGGDIAELKASIAELKASVDALDIAPPCGPDTAGERFVVDTGTSYVCDNTTGLHWQLTPGEPGEMFSTCDNAAKCEWAEAVGYCDALGSRMPEADELYSLVDLNQSQPALPPGNPFTSVTGGFYWSATLYAESGEDFRDYWAVEMGFGTTGYIKTPGQPELVWCVRDGS